MDLINFPLKIRVIFIDCNESKNFNCYYIDYLVNLIKIKIHIFS